MGRPTRRTGLPGPGRCWGCHSLICLEPPGAPSASDISDSPVPIRRCSRALVRQRMMSASDGIARHRLNTSETNSADSIMPPTALRSGLPRPTRHVDTAR